MANQEGTMPRLENLQVTEDRRRFISAPQALEYFLSSKRKNIHLLGSCCVELTKEKILHNVEYSEEVSEAQLFSAKLNLKPKTCLVVVSNISEIQRLIANLSKDITYKLVVVLPSSKVSELLNSICHSQEKLEFGFDHISWKGLRENLQSKIKSRLQQYAWLQFKDNNSFDNLKENDLIKLIKMQEGVLFVDLVPDQPSYYIERTIVSRNVVSEALFAKPADDIWLIENFDPLQLTAKAGKVGVDSCSNQLRGKDIKCSFLMVDMADSFTKICSRTNKSVHLLTSESGSLQWVKTRGSMASVISLLDLNNQKQLSESQFLERATSNDSTKAKVIFISDTPGMGKSYLVSSLGRKLQSLFPTRLVSFATCNYLTDIAKLSQVSEFNRDGLCRILTNMMCLNELGRHFLFNYLDTVACGIELIIDGYDETTTDCLTLTDELLLKIRSFFPNIRMWFTTRPQYLGHLEVLFGTFGYNILPFTFENQLKFLKCYWLSSAIVENKKVQSSHLEKYSKLCLSNVQQNMNKSEGDIVGVPLQCMLIAEIFKDDALKYSNSGGILSHTVVPKFNSTGLTDLFDLLVETRLNVYFQKNSNNNSSLRDKLLDIHFFHGLLHLFPKDAEGFRDILFHSDVTRQQYTAVGLMHSNTENEVPKFSHRSFAEYFVAKFSHNIITCDIVVPNFNSFFFGSLLVSHKTSSDVFLKFLLQTYQFDHLAICQFLNIMLGKLGSAKKLIQCVFMSFTPFLKNPPLMKTIGHACVQANLSSLFKLLIQDATIYEHVKDLLSDKEFLAVAISRCDVSFVEYCFKLFYDFNQSPLESVRLTSNRITSVSLISLLHVAIFSGRFSTTEFLLKNTNFRFQLANRHKDLWDIIHRCIEWSDQDTQEMVLGKEKILKYIENNKDFSWTLSCSHEGIIPIKCRSVNVAYMSTLLKTKSDYFLVNSFNETVFHHIAIVSCDGLHRLLLQASESLCNAEMSQLINLQNTFGKTILHQLCALGNPSVSILKLLKKYDADFNVEGTGYSPLAEAILAGKSVEILTALIELGADPKFKFRDQSNLIHLAAKYGQVNAAHFLISLRLGGITLDSKDIYARTPLHYAVIESKYSNVLGRQQFVQNYLAKLKIVNNITGDSHSAEKEDFQVTIDKGFSFYKVTSFHDTQETVKAVFFLQKTVTKMEDHKALLIFVIYDCNSLYYSKDGVWKGVHYFDAAQMKRPTLYDVAIILSKKLKFSMWHLHILDRATTDDTSKQGLLNWILEQNISDQLLMELLEITFHKFKVYACEQSNILGLALKYEKSIFIISWIISKGVLVNTSDENGNSPLHLAMNSQKTCTYEYILSLLQAGAYINAKNLQDQTPLSLSCSNQILNDANTFNILVANGAICNSTVATSTLIWFLTSVWPEHNFELTSSLLINNGANIYSYSEKFEATLLNFARRFQGQKRAAFLEKIFKDKNGEFTDEEIDSFGEDAVQLNSLKEDVFLFSRKFKNVNFSIPFMPSVQTAVNTKNKYSARTFEYLFKRITFKTICDIKLLLSFIIEKQLSHKCLELVYEWFQKNMSGDLTEHPLILNDGTEIDLLVIAVRVSNFEHIECLVEKVGFKNHLFSEKYKLIIRECIHLNESGRVIEFFGSINPELIHGDKEFIFSASNLNPNAFSAVVKIVGNMDSFAFTKENIFNSTGASFTILHKMIEIVDATKFHKIVQEISAKGLMKIFEPRDTFITPLVLSLEFFDVQEQTVELIAKSGVFIESAVLFFAARMKKPMNLIKCFISNGVDISNTRWHKDSTLLHYLVGSYVQSVNQLAELLECLLENELLHKLKCIDIHDNTVLYEIFQRFPLTDQVFDLLLKFTHPVSLNKLKQNTLHVAVDTKTPPKFLEKIISQKIKVYQKDADGKTCVHIAASKYSLEDFIEFIRILKKCNVLDVFNIFDNITFTPAMYAAYRASIFTVLVKELSKEKTIDWNISDLEERNVFHHAILHNEITDLEASFIQLTFECGANIRQKIKNGGTIAHCALFRRKDFHQLVLFLLKYDLHDILFIQDEYGFDAIAFAIAKCSLLPSTLQALIKTGINFKAYNIRNKSSYLHLSAKSNMSQNNIDCIKLLIANGVDPNWTSVNGFTFLHYMVEYNVPNQLDEIIKYLVSHNKPEVLTQVDVDGETPISSAIRKGLIFPKTINFLSLNNVDLKWQSTSGCTLLHIAIQNFDIDLLKALINGDVDISVLDSSGQTFFDIAPKFILEHFKRKYDNPNDMHKAVEEAALGFEALVVFLFDQNKTEVFKQTDVNGYLPLQKSLYFLDVTLKTLTILKESGVNLDLHDSNGWPPSIHAIIGGRSMTYMRSLMQMIKVTDSNKDGNTLAHILPQLCSADKFHEIVRILIDMGYEKMFSCLNNEKCSPFYFAVRSLEILPETLNLLIDAYRNVYTKPAQSNITGDVESQSILLAAARGKRSVVTLKTLISSDIDVLKRDADGNNFAHFLGCLYSPQDYHEIVTHLFENGYGKLYNISNDSGIYPIVPAVENMEIMPKTLHLLTGKQTKEVAISDHESSLLIDDTTSTTPKTFDVKIDLNVTDDHDYTVLARAVIQKKPLSIIKLLVEFGANPLVKNSHNNNLAHTAASFANIELLKYFVEIGCNINELDNDGDNALQCLVVDNNADIYEMLVYLVESGVNKTHRNKNGKTAYDYAVDKNVEDSRILSLLL